jgi:hypothetical protein
VPLIMAETGWPLIPRDALPPAAPVVAKGVRRVPVSHPDAGRQLPIFGAEATEPSPLDLAGLLAGPGRLGRMGGTARVSVQVDAAWRVHVLVAELVTRGLVVTWQSVQDPIQGPDREVRGGASPPEPVVAATAVDGADPGHDHAPGDEPAATRADGTGDGAAGSEVRAEPVARSSGFEVRTAYSSRLKVLARTWPAATDRLFLTGPGLRLWVAAAGRPVDGGYALGLGNPGIAVDVPLRRAGLDGVLSDHGSHYLISGRKPLHRLAELVGERPAAAPVEAWPGAGCA